MSTSPPGLPGRLSAIELSEQLRDGTPLQLVDVREEQELGLARLPHPVLHLPLSRSTDWMERIDELLDPGRPVAVLCHSGVRSWHFGCWLAQERGYPEVWNLEGGIEAWSRDVDPSVPRY